MQEAPHTQVAKRWGAILFNTLNTVRVLPELDEEYKI